VSILIMRPSMEMAGISTRCRIPCLRIMSRMNTALLGWIILVIMAHPGHRGMYRNRALFRLCRALIDDHEE
jgi:hypothetical protein